MKSIFFTLVAAVTFNSFAFAAEKTCYMKNGEATKMLPALVCLKEEPQQISISFDDVTYKPAIVFKERSGQTGTELTYVELVSYEDGACSNKEVSRLILSAGNLMGAVYSTPDWCHSSLRLTETAEYVAQ